MAILGGGESGVGAAMLAKKQGLEPFVSDFGLIKKNYKEVLNGINVNWEEEGHDADRLVCCAEVIKSPGIPNEAPIVKLLEKEGLPIISEIEFAYRFCSAMIIAITGSNGKTTTANLLYHLLKNAGLNVGLAGNVGKSFAASLVENDFEYYVLEVSSFQLDNIDQFRAEIAILLNISEDHLDRYDHKLERYANAKIRIAENSKAEDFFIYCKDNEVLLSALKGKPVKAHHIPFSIQKQLPEGAYINQDQLIIQIQNNQFTMSIHELALQGKHNLYNSMASGIAGRILDLRKEIIRESLSDFQNIEHRLEHVATIHGIDFINDSKATNVNSTWYALESITKPTVWIVGGVDKGNDYSELNDLIQDKVKAIICLGKDNKKIIKSFKDSIQVIEEASSADEAVKIAYEIAQKGDAVLLSPACASFDLFENYEDRGHQFKRAVRAL